MTACAGLVIGLCLGLTAMQTPEQPARREYKRAAGPYQVAELLRDWHDEQRNRDVPVKIYYPQSEWPASSEVGNTKLPVDPGPFPVILFSHGLGGSRETYAYLGRHWASHGYVCVHVQHRGSDDEIWKGQAQPLESMKRAVANPRSALERPRDIHFVIDRLERLAGEDGPLKGRLDLSRIGMAGHSFGAFTTMAVAGQAFIAPDGKAVTADDWRLKVKAAIAMSPNPPARRDRLDDIYAQVRIPILHMTGTRDDSPIGDTKAADRRIPFDHIKNAEQYLVIFQGGDHMVFSGRKRLRGDTGGHDARFQDLIRMSTTAFWDVYLKGGRAARTWLAEGGFGAAMGADGTFEKKPASRPAP